MPDKQIHVWEMIQIILEAGNHYDNPYTDVECWIDLKGPDFSRRVYGFWDGENRFKVRFTATKPGEWTWTCGSNQPDDKGFADKRGGLNAIPWGEEEKLENPNRRGFIRPSVSGHALQYADGTPFFLTGDTWLAGSTWRLPFRGAAPHPDYIPGPGIGFEDAVAFRKRQGFNSVSMISCFPNWEADFHPSTYADVNGVYLRNAWEKFDYPAFNGGLTAKNMRDEYGNMSFFMSASYKGAADFDRINPGYFRSLDRKMEYLSDQGFVPLLETVRRDNCPAWKAYSAFNESYARFVHYIIARYGAYNIIFSGIHLDWIPKEYSLTAEEFNNALTYHFRKYGPPPFSQPYTTLINDSTYSQFGHYQNCPWLTMHSVGNKPRDHRMSYSLEAIFSLDPPFPACNLEPYYTGWNHEINMPGGERPPADSERDNYFARAQMYGSVLSGGLAGHVHGTSAYDMTAAGEPPGSRPHFWDALMYESGRYMQHLKAFILSEGDKYQRLHPCSGHIHPQKATGSPESGLDGWAYMMCTPGKDFALLYFENRAVLPVLSGFTPYALYHFRWYDPANGQWGYWMPIKVDGEGELIVPLFPDGRNPSGSDWAAKIVESSFC